MKRSEALFGFLSLHQMIVSISPLPMCFALAVGVLPTAPECAQAAQVDLVTDSVSKPSHALGMMQHSKEFSIDAQTNTSPVKRFSVRTVSGMASFKKGSRLHSASKALVGKASIVPTYGWELASVSMIISKNPRITRHLKNG